MTDTDTQDIVNPPKAPREPEIVTDTRDKLLYLLGIYPYLSRTMIQVGLSPALPPALWDPILQNLVASGRVKLTQINTMTPKDRALAKDIYHLPEFPYPPLTVEQLRNLGVKVQ